MGVTFKIEDGYVTGSVDGRLKGANINLNVKFLSVQLKILLWQLHWPKEQLSLLTLVQEPEISDLSKLLIRMGANIKGFGTKKL